MNNVSTPSQNQGMHTPESPHRPTLGSSTPAALPTPPADSAAILDKIYSRGEPPIGSAIFCLASATSTSPELAALAISALLGGIAGPEAHILGPADNPISPGFSLCVVGGDDASWQGLQRLILSPVEALQAQLRDMSRAVRPDRLAALETGTNKCNNDATKQLYAIASRELKDTGLGLGGPLDGVRAGVALRQPSVLLVSPAPGCFKSGIEEILDRHAAVAYPTGRLFEELARFVPSRPWLELLKAITDAVEGHDEGFQRTHANEGYGRLAALRATLLLTCKETHAKEFVGATNPDLQRLLSQCLVVRPNYCPPVPLQPRKQLCAAHSFYVEAATKVLATRRSGMGMRFQVNDAGYELLTEFSAYVRSTLPKVPELPQRDWVVDLGWKVSWAMMALKGYSDSGDWCVPFAIHVAHKALHEHLAFSREELTKRQSQQAEETRQILLARLARMGPSTLRMLVRTFKNQRRDLYAPVLDGLVSSGLVVCRDSHYSLAAPAAAKEVA